MSTLIKRKYSEEAYPGFNARTAMEEASRCLLCEDPPCSGGCPAGTDPGKFIRSIRFRNVKGAAETIRENNILGGSCARVCPYDRLCEKACSRTGIDKPIHIGKLQRFAIEQEKIFGMRTLRAPVWHPSGQKSGSDPQRTAHSPLKPKVACVGSGPASLACSAELAKNGCAVTGMLFEGRDGYSSLKLKADTVVFAIGQEAGDIAAIAPVGLTDRGTAVVDTVTGGTGIAGIFAAGDIVNGGKTVVEAVAQGKTAASGILDYLRKKEGRNGDQ